MEKKSFISPSVRIIKSEVSAMICGSGSITGTLPKGSGSNPGKSSQGGYTGIFTEARSAGSGISLTVLDF